MGERFSILYSLEDNLYLKDFPIILSAGRLMLDTTTAKTIVQLKFKNLGEKKFLLLKSK